MTTTETTTSTAQKKNVPSHEIFLVEDNGQNQKSTWTKVGVAFKTKSGNSHRVLIGQRGDPKQKVYLVCPNSVFDGNREAQDTRGRDDGKRIPYASIFDATKDNIDFKRKDGVAFLNRDDSLSLLIGERGDPNLVKYQMRAVKPRGAKPAAK